MISHAQLAQYCADIYQSNDVWSVSEVDAQIHDGLNDELIIVLRGTEAARLWPWKWSWQGLSNWRDVIRDLRFVAVDTHYGKAHKGGYISAVRWLREFRDDIPRDRPISITGHSLGAMVTTQLAALMAMHGFNVQRVVNFGEPAGIYGAKSLRRYDALPFSKTSYLNHGDWIKFTPPWGAACAERTKIKAFRRGHDVKHYVQVLGEIRL